MQKKKRKIPEDELYEEIVEELRFRIKCRKELLELARIILDEEISEEDVDWKNL